MADQAFFAAAAQSGIMSSTSDNNSTAASDAASAAAPAAANSGEGGGDASSNQAQPVGDDHGATSSSTSKDGDAKEAASVLLSTTSSSRDADDNNIGSNSNGNSTQLRGRSKDIIAEDAPFAKRTVTPSRTRSALSASRPSSPTRASASASASASAPGSGAQTPADLSQEEQLLHMKSKIADLTSQVTSLNGKLVASYNRIGNLEEDTDHKVMQVKELSTKIERLEAERKTWEDKYEGGLLVEKDHVQLELTRMMDRVIEETASRGKAENDKAQIERELAELSSQLFAEANSMVAMERKERLKAERKMEEIERNLKDTEGMMIGQSTQMRELGNKLEELEHEREELRKQIEEMQNGEEESAMNASTVSMRSDIGGGGGSTAGGTTPGMVPSSLPDVAGSYLGTSVSSQPSLFLQMPLPANALAPGTPGSAITRAIVFSHPIQFLSFEVAPFQEFILFTKSMARVRRSIMSRPIINPEKDYGYSSYPAPYAAHGMGASTTFPGYMSESDRQSAIKEALPLSQYLHTPFIKRIVEEDSDPTLRLEAAPGLSFFSRRQIATSIVDGNLAIEPAFTSLPSDKCSLCGCSLEKFIASHQVTQPKDDPRKKLTRLATGWIPSSISGTATPTREAQEKNNRDSVWGISALSDALGALTPSGEIGGFSFGTSSEKDKASQGHYTPYTGSSSRPGTSGGRPSTSSGHRSSFGAVGSAAPPDRKASMPPLDRKLSASSTKAESDAPKEKDGLQHDYVLTQSARQQGQIYLFRSLESNTRYTLCPNYCLPRLRAVCELWNYIRHIHKGLLLEDNPKIYPSAFGTSNEYTKLVRRVTASLLSSQTQIAGNVIQQIKTPAPGVSRQLGDGFKPSSLQHSSTLSTPPIVTTTNSIQGLAPGVPMGLGLSMTGTTNNQAEATPTTNGDANNAGLSASSAASTSGEDDQSSAKASEPSTAASSVENLIEGKQEEPRTSLDGKREEPSEGAVGSDNKSGESAPTSASVSAAGPALPFRPPRSAARGAGGSSPMTPTSSTDGSKPTLPVLSAQSLQTASSLHGDKTPTQVQHDGEVAITSNASTGQAASASATPKSPVFGSTSMPPPLPPRSPRPDGRPKPGKISLPNSNLSSSLTSEGWGGPAVPSVGAGGPMSASATGSASASGVGPVQTSQVDWQQKCWYEVIRLKEGVFWSRVGANYNKET